MMDWEVHKETPTTARSLFCRLGPERSRLPTWPGGGLAFAGLGSPTFPRVSYLFPVGVWDDERGELIAAVCCVTVKSRP